MATVPPRPKSLANNVIEFARRALHRPVVLTDAQKAVADWLRGNRQAAESLRNLILARCEGRASSPIPSDPTSALIDKARDFEDRSIATEIMAICNLPVPDIHRGEEE